MTDPLQPKFIKRSRVKKMLSKPLQKSRYLSVKTTRTLLHSARAAASIGRPLNTFITINLWKFGLTNENASAFVRSVLIEQRFSRWSNYIPAKETQPRNGKPTYVGVIEDQTGGHVHLHMMVHLEAKNKLTFKANLEKWLMAEFDLDEIPARSVQVQHGINAEGLKKYFAKSTNPFYARLCKIRPEDTGEIYGRRGFNSRNIGPAVWKPLREAYRAGKAVKAVA